jgi:hypothetical protein
MPLTLINGLLHGLRDAFYLFSESFVELAWFTVVDLRTCELQSSEDLRVMNEGLERCRRFGCSGSKSSEFILGKFSEIAKVAEFDDPLSLFKHLVEPHNRRIPIICSALGDR